MTKFVSEQIREEVQKEAREEALKATEEVLKVVEEERQKRLRDNRRTLINLVQRLFPSLVVLARRQAESITESSILQAMITKMFSAKTLEEAVQYLVEVPDATEKHDE